MNDIYTRWMDTTGKWEKTFAAFFIIWAIIRLATLIAWPTWDTAADAIIWWVLTYAIITSDYYRCRWRKFESLTDFGAAMGHHLHTWGDLLLEKNGDHYKVTPLTHGSRND